jgi:hypothetical protein
MLDAIRWANSDDPKERALAVTVFVDIGTSEARKYEETLTRDPDQGSTARQAQSQNLVGTGRTLLRI